MDFPLKVNGRYICGRLGDAILASTTKEADKKFLEWAVQELNRAFKDEYEAQDRGG